MGGPGARFARPGGEFGRNPRVFPSRPAGSGAPKSPIPGRRRGRRGRPGPKGRQVTNTSKPVYAADNPVASRCRHPAVRPLQVGENPFYFRASCIFRPSDSGPRTIGHRWHKASGQACIFIEMRKCRRVFRMHFAHRPCITSIRKYARLARKGRQELRHQAPLCLVHCCVI